MAHLRFTDVQDRPGEFLDLTSHRGRTASYPTAPAQIPACGFLAPGSSDILAAACWLKPSGLPSLAVAAQQSMGVRP